MLATKLRDTFSRIGQVLEAEELFLKFASHELRTPIAVISSNLDLIERLDRNNQGLELEARRRIKRSVTSMLQLTETLLWLSRENDKAPENEKIRLDQLIDLIITENNYLLENKPINVSVCHDKSIISAPKALCKIALSNLVRNAFEHSLPGNIEITIHNKSVCILNPTGEQDSEEITVQGFGLGLLLVEKITTKFGWNYLNIQGGDETKASIDFS